MKQSALLLLLTLLLISCSNEDDSSDTTKQLIGQWVAVEYNEYFEMDGELYHDETDTWDPETTSYSNNEYITFLSESRVKVYEYYDDAIQPNTYTYFVRNDSLFIREFGNLLWGTFRFANDTLIIDDISETGGEYISETSFIQYSGELPGVDKSNSNEISRH